MCGRHHGPVVGAPVLKHSDPISMNIWQKRPFSSIYTLHVQVDGYLWKGKLIIVRIQAMKTD